MTTILTVSSLRAEDTSHGIGAQQIEEGFGDEERKRCADHADVRDAILDQVNTLESLSQAKGMLLGLELAKKSSSECAVKIESIINKFKTDFRKIYSQDVDIQIRESQHRLVGLMEHQRCLSSSDIKLLKIKKEYANQLEEIIDRNIRDIRNEIINKGNIDYKLRKDIK
jgi:hypothetical protein